MCCFLLQVSIIMSIKIVLVLLSATLLFVSSQNSNQIAKQRAMNASKNTVLLTNWLIKYWNCLLRYFTHWTSNPKGPDVIVNRSFHWHFFSSPHSLSWLVYGIVWHCLLPQTIDSSGNVISYLMRLLSCFSG